MYQTEHLNGIIGRRYALCVGIGRYTELPHCNLRYAISDAQCVADILKDPQKGDFAVTLLTTPNQTTRNTLMDTLYNMLNGSSINPEDLFMIFISCHGYRYGKGNTFALLPSDARDEDNASLKRTSLIDIHDLAKILSGAKAKNIIFLLDACYSGGAGYLLQQLNFDRDLSPDTNLFIIGAARHDQVAIQSSYLQHGIFTSYLIQALEQKPLRSDGWITISEIHSFISDGVKSYNRADILQIQSIAATVNPNLPITKNPHYSPHSLEFHEQVKRLLMLMHYEVSDIEEIKDAPPGFYVAEITAGLMNSKRSDENRLFY